MVGANTAIIESSVIRLSRLIHRYGFKLCRIQNCIHPDPRWTWICRRPYSDDSRELANMSAVSSVAERELLNEERKDDGSLTEMVSQVRLVLREPILRILLERSSLTSTQLETLLIDLLTDDASEGRVSYEQKASLRGRGPRGGKGVSRGAFNRTLKQARRNVMRSIYTLLVLAYLGLFELSIFRPFEEVATRVGAYRSIREALAARHSLSPEDVEAYRAAERVVLDALDLLQSPLALRLD